MKKRLIIGATGASGMPILIQCLKLMKEQDDFESYLIMTDSAKLTLEHETKMKIEEIEQLADHVIDSREIGAGPASGSFKTEGMLIVPCSMKTIAGIHSGYADNLVLRAADVTIKEHSIPPMMTFYHMPETIEEMTYHIAAKLLEPFGIEAKEYRRWTGI